MEETRVRVGREEGKSFWTARGGIRQGCPLSPILFNLLTADLEEEMGRVKWGGIRLGGERMYMLACADDLVLIAEDEEGMRIMIERLERYMERKRLEVNTEKMKIMRLGGGEAEWRGRYGDGKEESWRR